MNRTNIKSPQKKIKPPKNQIKPNKTKKTSQAGF